MNQQPYNDMQLVKRRFFAMRNGIITDTLRKAGSPYKIIFGVNLPQIREIAADFAPNASLAERLWADERTRESMMLAPWLLPDRKLEADDASRWLRSAVSTEAVDILCMACLRNAPYAARLSQELAQEQEPMMRYAAMRLMLNNLNEPLFKQARQIAEAVGESDPVMLQALSRQILDELEWLES